MRADEQVSAAIGGCSAESGRRGPAIRYALPLRPPERSRGTTGRPALCPFDAGAAHLAAAAPKRARRPGALRAGCQKMPAKRLPLRVETPITGGKRWIEVNPDHIHRLPSLPSGFEPVRPLIPLIAPSSLTLGDLRRQGSMP